MKDHIFDTVLDLGVLGEKPVEVFYDWIESRKSNDPFEAPEGSGAVVVAVICWLDGKEVNLYDYLNGDLISDLEYECFEDYNG